MEHSFSEKIQNITDLPFYKTEFYFKQYMEKCHDLKETDFINEDAYRIFLFYKQCIGFNSYIDGEQTGLNYVHPDSYRYLDYYMIMINETDHPKLYKLWKSTKKYNLNYYDSTDYKFICYFVCKLTGKKFLHRKCAEKWLFSTKYKEIIKQKKYNDYEEYLKCDFNNYTDYYKRKQRLIKLYN